MLNLDYRLIIAAASTLLVAVALKFLVDNVISRRKRLPFPPGPKPLPIVGNMFDMPSSRHGTQYIEWGKKYDSNILHATVLGQHYVILNSLEDAQELFEKRARFFSDRAEDPILTRIGWTANMAFLPRNDIWRRNRRVAQQHFRQEAVPEFHELQTEKVHKMLRGLLETPEMFEDHSKMLSISIPMAMMYGHNLESLKDPVVVAADENATMAFKLLQPGYTLLGIFPFLMHIPTWVPGAVTQRMIKETRRLTDLLRRKPLETVKEQLKEGTAAPSIVAHYLSGSSSFEEDEQLIGDLGFTTYVAAADTTISATATLLYALATHPEIQKKAQEEIDSVVGRDRLPIFEDRPSMPYVEAMYREVMRWKPVLPLAVAHHAAEDDVYRGYFIPKGTGVIPNVWAMTHDESKYKDPNAFNPGRFFDADGNLNDDDRVLTFGFGHRVCVGKHVASATMWLIIASILAAYNIGKKKDEMGRDIEIDGEYDEVGLISRVKPFPCSITPRSEKAKKLVLETKTEY